MSVLDSASLFPNPKEKPDVWPELNIDCDVPNVDDVNGDEVVVEVNGDEVDPEPPKISALVAS